MRGAGLGLPRAMRAIADGRDYSVPSTFKTPMTSPQQLFDRGYVVVTAANYENAIYFEDHRGPPRVYPKK